jgi:catechol 2,3-dioxygenase-like lactoylglutathione lyase family enzyme
VVLPVRFDNAVIKVSDWDRSDALHRDVLGGTSVHFRDPDGSLLEFISYSE